MEDACYFFYGSQIERFPRIDPSLLCGTVPFLQSTSVFVKKDGNNFLEIAIFFIKEAVSLVGHRKTET